MPHDDRRFSPIPYLFVSVVLLSGIASLDRWVEGLRVFTDVSFRDIRNLVFYTLLCVAGDLILAALMATPILLWMNRSGRPRARTTAAALLAAIPLYVVATPRILMSLAYRGFDNEMTTPVRLGFYLGVSLAILAALAVLSALFRLPGRVATAGAGFRRASRNVLLACGAAGLFVALAAGLSASRAPGGDPQRRNVLLVVIDTLRRDFVGAYGSPLETTPFLDRLASEGLLFEHAFSSAPTSVAGHTSILFGLGVEEHKTLSNTFTVDRRLESIAETLQRRGYFTFGVCANQLISAESGFGQGYDFYWERKQTFVHDAPLFFFAFSHPLTQIALTALKIDLTNTLAAHFLVPRNRPFFGFVQYLHCHEPYIDHSDPPWRTPARMARLEKMFRQGELPRTTDWPLERDLWKTGKYAGSIRYVDSLVQQLMDLLEKRGLGDDTVVIVTADHGENLTEHGDEYAYRHDGYFTTSHAIPLLLWARDLPLAGAAIPGITGQDRIRELVTDAASDESVLFSPSSTVESVAGLTRKDHQFAFTKETFVLFDDSLKFVTSVSAEPPFRKLFRWREDPFDRHDLLADSTSVPEEAKKMQETVASIVSENGIIDAWGTKRELTANQLRNLKALGYL